jgi:hypothetical protein
MGLNMLNIIKRMKAAGTPGAKNTSLQLRGRTTSQGKAVVPVKAKTPTQLKQKNPKGKRSVKSNPVGYKNVKVKDNKGGNPTPKISNKRGGYGAARANLGFTGATRPIRSVIGKSG